MESYEFVAIGDTVVDEFIELKDASVHCDINSEHCTISMRWGDKIPFKEATLIAGVGNSANAAVAAARLGLRTALVTDIGVDRDGDEIVAALKKEGLPEQLIRRHRGIKTNHHYVLSYDSERTILVKHEAFPYRFPAHLPPPQTLYLSSLGEGTDAYHDQIADYVEKHKDMFLIIQPGTFQMKLGIEKLSRLYKRADLLILNKEESERVLGHTTSQEMKTLLEGLHALGPKMVVITDGRDGACASDGTKTYFVPMYPDTRAPKERTGAGDAFSSTLAAALTLKKPLSEALLWAPINSMAVVQEIGAQRGLLSREKLEAFLSSAPESYKIEER